MAFFWSCFLVGEGQTEEKKTQKHCNKNIAKHTQKIVLGGCRDKKWKFGFFYAKHDLCLEKRNNGIFVHTIYLAKFFWAKATKTRKRSKKWFQRKWPKTKNDVFGKRLFRDGLKCFTNCFEKLFQLKTRFLNVFSKTQQLQQKMVFVENNE